MSNANFIAHATAIIDPGANIGDETRIWHWTHVSGGAQVGARCSFGQNVYVGNRVTIGNNVRVQNNVSIYDDVTLEDDVFCGPSMVFTNVINPRAHVSRKHEYRPTLVRQGASIGANATIVCGVTIGRYAFIGAGAVVTRDVPSYSIVAGVPAKPLRRRFPEEIASRIEALAWWDWTPEKLAKAVPDMQALPIEAFLDRWEHAG